MTDPAPRAVFFEEDHALAVASRLVADGFTAAVVQERLAGEDDDEDHPWAVTSDAPPLLMELLVEEHDGWLEQDAPPRPATPLALPDAPRRLKRPLGGDDGPCA